VAGALAAQGDVRPVEAARRGAADPVERAAPRDWNRAARHRDALHWAPGQLDVPPGPGWRRGARRWAPVPSDVLPGTG